MVHFPTRKKNTMELILTTLPGQFKDVHSPDKLSDHDIVSGTLKIFIPPIKKPQRKVYLYQKGDYESMRKDTLEFAKEKYFNGHSDTRSVQENFDLLTSFIQDSADKHIPSKTSRLVSSIPWITPEIRRKIHHHHHHHHIHFRALFSSTEGWAFWQVFLEGVLSTQNGSEGQQNPYLASFCHSQALHPMISLACQIFSVQPHSACVLLQSSLCCALHVQTISSYWCGASHLSPGCQALWEGSLS